MTSLYIQQKLRPFGTARKAAATDVVDLKKTEFNQAHGRGRQEVQEQLVGFPDIMMRDFRNVPREQLRQEERERAKAIREAIKRKRQVVSPKNSTENPKQVREYKNEELQTKMASLNGEVSGSVTESQPKPKQRSSIQRIRSVFRGEISTSEPTASKYHTEYNPSYGHGRQEIQELSRSVPGIMHHDVRNLPRKQRDEAIRTVRKKRNETEDCPPSCEPPLSGLQGTVSGSMVSGKRRTTEAPSKIPKNKRHVSMELESTEDESGTVQWPVNQLQRQTNPFLASAELEIIDEEEVYDEINESEMLKMTS